MDEAESEPLAQFLNGAPYVSSSAIAEVEVLRAAARYGLAFVGEAARVIRELELVPVNLKVLSRAALLEPATLRTLDAIHIASALALGDALEVLVTYDRRMAEAAEAIGIRVAAPA